MLVLGRLKGERLAIVNDDGEVVAIVTVVEFDRRGKARIGIDASDDVMVLREEVFTKCYGELKVGKKTNGPA